MLAKNMINMGRKGGKLDVQFHGHILSLKTSGRGDTDSRTRKDWN